MSVLKIALVQLEQVEEPAAYDKTAQLRRVADLIRAAPYADVYVLPELAPTGRWVWKSSFSTQK